MPHGGQEGGGVLPNGGGREQRERLPFFSSPLFSSFNCHPLRSKLSPSFSFPALSPLFKKTLLLFSKTLPPLLVFQPSLLFSKTLLLFSKTLPPF
jgi:hypothetical protein